MQTFVKFFLLITLPIFITLIFSFFFIQKTVSGEARNQLLQDTKQKWTIASEDFIDVNERDTAIYEKYSNISEETSLRFTLIDKSGRVLIDSDVSYSEIQHLDNHANRPEIKAAYAKGEGSSIRYSKTVNEKLFYFAKTLPNGNVLRLAYPLFYLTEIENSINLQMSIVFAVLTITIGIIAALLARKFSLPIQKLNYIADNIEDGKTNIHFPRFRDAHMAKIASLIYKIYNAMLQKQNTIKNEQEKLKLIFTVMDEGIILTDLDNNIIHVNDSFLELFDVNLKIGDNLHKALNDAELINFFDDIMQKDNIKRTQIPFREKVFEVYLNTLDSQKLVIIHDITGRIKYELFKAELTGNISHELKTPISMIMNYAETLISNDSLDTKTRKKFLQTIYSSSNRLNELINDIVELHKLESVGDDFEVDESVNLVQMKEDLETLYSATKGISVNFQVDDLNVNIFNEHLYSIITNLVDNAVKYSDGDKIDVFLKKSGDYLVVTVDDEGPRIPEADRDRIFERFYTCSKSRNKQYSGTGLGLSIVKHIASLYEGVVKLKTNSYGGNSFQVYLKGKV